MEVSSDDQQIKLNAMLRRGVVFTIVWLAGIGSLIALYSGLRARRVIIANPSLQGMGRAWWCIIVGGAGVVLVATLLVVAAFTPGSI